MNQAKNEDNLSIPSLKPLADPQLQGLNQSKVAELRAKGLGNNVIFQTTRTYPQILKDNVFTFLNFVPTIIGIVMVVLGLYSDAITSVGVVFLNTVVSLFQEVRAKRKLDKIIVLTTPKATVVREGKEQTIDQAEIVVGDILAVKTGDQIVVDGELVGAGALEVDESLLTGESEAVAKSAGHQVFSGSFCLSGKAFYVAQKVGAASYANQLTRGARVYRRILTPLQQQMYQVVRWLLLIALFFGLILVVTALANSLPLQKTIQEAAVIAALVPNGLFIMITLAYGLGAVRLARKGALVQQFNALESLSHVDVLCLDKTGTLTANQLQVESLYPAGVSEAELGRILGIYATSTEGGNKTNQAIAARFGGQILQVEEVVAFSSERRWSAVSFDQPELRGVYVLGAADILKPYLPLSSEIEDQSKTLAAEGYRVLLLARQVELVSLRDKEGQPCLPTGLQPLGLVALSDVLRPQARQTLQAFSKAGIILKVISGDNPVTVAALVKQAGLGSDIQAISGTELDGLEESDWGQVAEENTVFGRINPQQKQHLVKALQQRGHYVAMIGDGVNDVLSLKQANLAVAMESGSPATRGAAAILLLNDSFAALPVALLEGQRIGNAMGDNLKLHLPRILFSYLLIISLGMAGLGFPFLPRQSSLITFLTVGLPVLGITVWASTGRPRDSRLITSALHFIIPATISRVLLGLGVYIGYYFATYQSLKVQQPWLNETELATQAQTIAKTVLIVVASLSGLALLVFVRPPLHGLAGGADYSGDWRPTLLTFLTFLMYLIIQAVPATRDFFALAALPISDYLILAVLVIIWAVLLQVLWKKRLLEKFLNSNWQK